jgi:succinate dehydrogenase/fumarate reductase flavoprotein subunit
MNVITIISNQKSKDFDRVLAKMQTIMSELAEIDRLMKAAEQARKRYEELKSELAAVCKEYTSLYGGE